MQSYMQKAVSSPCPKSSESKQTLGEKKGFRKLKQLPLFQSWQKGLVHKILFMGIAGKVKNAKRKMEKMKRKKKKEGMWGGDENSKRDSW